MENQEEEKTSPQFLSSVHNTSELESQMPGSAWQWGWKWHSCSSHAAPLLYSSAANCLLRGTTLEAVTLQTAPGEARHS